LYGEEHSRYCLMNSIVDFGYSATGLPVFDTIAVCKWLPWNTDLSNRCDWSLLGLRAHVGSEPLCAIQLRWKNALESVFA
jgi:hypothetical protein